LERSGIQRRGDIMDARNSRLLRLENRIDLKRQIAQEERARRRKKLFATTRRRFVTALKLAIPLFGEADQLRLNPPGERLPHDWVLQPWFHSLILGRSKLPNLQVQTTRALLEAWLHPKVYCYSMVCLACGLCRPELDPVGLTWEILPGKVPLVGPPPWYDVPNFFNCCPHCQSTRHNWTHLIQPTCDEVSG
jgi:hypothetical protein